MFGVIYGIENMLNHKIYIGQTHRDIEVRLNEHKNCKTSLIGRAIKKYGWENFICIILEECNTKEELDAAEIRWIAGLNCMVPNGYNMNAGGCGSLGHQTSEETRKKLSEINSGKRLSEETRKKISATKRANFEKTHQGRKLTDETKAKISAARLGYSPSEETRKKLSAASTGNKNALGCQRSEETRKKISATKRANFEKTHQGRKLTDEIKAKISAARLGYSPSEETRKKLSAASTGNKNALGCQRSEETRKKISATKRANFEKAHQGRK